MEKTPKELGIGSWGNICTISIDTLLIEAMKIFLEKRVSALPLLDRDGRVSWVMRQGDVPRVVGRHKMQCVECTMFP